MKALIINNLQSGLRDGSIYEFVRKLSQDGGEIVIRSTDGNTPVESLLSNASEFDFVVASGGDGTISSVCYALRDTRIPILPFPAGTGNLLLINLDQPEEPYALVNMVKEGYTLDFDLGELSFYSGEEKKTRGFSLMCGAGYDATIMQASEPLKQPLGPVAYVVAALGNPAPKLARFTLQLDEQTHEVDAIAVLVINFAKIYPDISITHDNDARDGQLEIAVLKPHNTVELLPAIIAAFLDRTGRYPNRTDAVETFKAKYVKISSEPELSIQYDGEAPGAVTPLEAWVLPGAVRLFITRKEYERLTQAPELSAQR